MKISQEITALFRKQIQRNGSLLRLLATGLVVLVIMLVLTGPSRFLSAKSISAMMLQMPELGILTLAVTFALFLGGIDLSVVSTANLSGIIAAMLAVQLSKNGMDSVGVVLLSYAAALAVGCVCGLLNGIVISRTGVPAMLATLGTMEVYKGIGLILTDGSAVTGLPSAYGFLGSASLGSIPLIMIIFVLAIIVAAVTMRRRRFGLEVYLLGTNEKAAEFSGIDHVKVTIKAFVCSGMLAAAAGIIISSRVMTAKADYGSSYILQCLLVAILGGISPFGGFGNVAGILIAIVTLQMLSSGFNMLRFSSYQKLAVWGAILILVMVMNYLLEKMRERRNIKKNLRKRSVKIERRLKLWLTWIPRKEPVQSIPKRISPGYCPRQD